MTVTHLPAYLILDQDTGKITGISAVGSPQVSCKVIDNASVDQVQNLVVQPSHTSNKASGLHVGFLGGSIEMRSYPVFDALSAQYSRSGGVVTMVLAGSSGLMRRFRGHEIMIASKEVPAVEGIFRLTADTVDDGTFTTITFADGRADLTLGAGLNINVMDRQSWSFTGGWPAYMCMALGGRAHAQGVGISGAEVYQLYDPATAVSRVDAFIARGPYAAVVLAGGGIGNSVASATTASGAAEIYTQLCTLVSKLLTVTGKVYIGTFTTSRGKLPSVAAWTRGVLLQKAMYKRLATEYPGVEVVQLGESVASTYSPYDVATPTDVAYGYPPAEFMDPDGVHQSFRQSVRMGLVLAEKMGPFVQDAQPWTSFYSQTRVQNPVADKDGTLNPSVLPTWFGQVSTVALVGTGLSGICPTNVACLFGARGGASAVGSMRTNPRGGSDFVLTVTDTAPSGLGATLGIAWSPPELLTALNSAEFQGQEIDLWMPIEITGFLEGGIRHVEMYLQATAGGVDRIITACLLEQGGKTMLLFDRTMGDDGIAGIVPSPRPARVPQGVVFTAASLIWSVRHSGSATTPGGPGTYTIAIGPTTTLELLK